MSDKIKILIGVESLGGGVLRHIVDLCLNLNKEKYELHLVSSLFHVNEETNESIRLLQNNGTETTFINIAHNLSWTDGQTINYIAKYIRKHNISIVHAHSTKAGVIFRIAAFICRKPCCYTPHCFYFESRKGVKRFLAFYMEKFLSSLCKKIILSENEYLSAVRNKIARKEKLHIINNSIDSRNYTKYQRDKILTELNIPQQNIVIGGVGRLVPQKNWQAFIYTAAVLIDSRKNISFIISGDGPEKENLLDLSGRLGITDKIIFTGHTENISKIYSCIDIFVSCSLWEGLPYSYLEAVHYNLPMFLSDINHIREYFKNYAYYFDPSRPEELLSLILKYMDHRPTANKSLQHRNKFEDFIKLHEKLYDNL